MRVKAYGDAKYVGYYNLVRRKAGDVFDLNDPKDFSKRWMIKVNDPTVVPTPAPGEPTPEEKEELSGKRKGKR